MQGKGALMQFELTTTAPKITVNNVVKVVVRVTANSSAGTGEVDVRVGALFRSINIASGAWEVSAYGLYCFETLSISGNAAGSWKIQVEVITSEPS